VKIPPDFPCPGVRYGLDCSSRNQDSFLAQTKFPDKRIKSDIQRFQGVQGVGENRNPQWGLGIEVVGDIRFDIDKKGPSQIFDFYLRFQPWIKFLHFGRAGLYPQFRRLIRLKQFIGDKINSFSILISRPSVAFNQGIIFVSLPGLADESPLYNFPALMADREEAI